MIAARPSPKSLCVCQPCGTPRPRGHGLGERAASIGEARRAATERRTSARPSLASDCALFNASAAREGLLSSTARGESICQLPTAKADAYAATPVAMNTRLPLSSKTLRIIIACSRSHQSVDGYASPPCYCCRSGGSGGFGRGLSVEHGLHGRSDGRADDDDHGLRRFGLSRLQQWVGNGGE